MTTRFCEQCGAALAPESRFCEGCGHPVEPGSGVSAARPIPSPTIPAPAPAPSPAPMYAAPSVPAGYPATTAGGNKGLPLALIAVVVLAAAGGGGWWWMNRAKPPATGTPPPATTGATPGTPAPAAGEGFVGAWFAEDDSGNTDQSERLVITRQGNKLIGVSDQGSEGRIEVAIVPGNKVQGTFTDSNGDVIPVTMELLSDGKKMVLTLAPPASEYQTVVLWKEEAEPTGMTPSSTGRGLTEDGALAKVNALTEVADFAKSLAAQGKGPQFEISLEDASTYSVRVYETVDDGSGVSHTATFGWYKVDRNTGAVTPGM